jgi:hypothetical protein
MNDTTHTQQTQSSSVDAAPRRTTTSEAQQQSAGRRGSAHCCHAHIAQRTLTWKKHIEHDHA